MDELYTYKSTDARGWRSVPAIANQKLVGIHADFIQPLYR